MTATQAIRSPSPSPSPRPRGDHAPRRITEAHLSTEMVLGGLLAEVGS